MSAEQRLLPRASTFPGVRRSTVGPASSRITRPPATPAPAMLPSSSASSQPPAPHPILAPAMIRSQLCVDEPPIVLVAFTGRISLADITNSRDFGNVVKSLGGKPFRVLCDFTQTITMPADVCAVFVKGQEFAVARGMERDAFVCKSSVLRLQFARIARESGRITSLGPLRFFDGLDEGRAYLQR